MGVNIDKVIICRLKRFTIKNKDKIGGFVIVPIIINFSGLATMDGTKIELAREYIS